MPALRTCGNTSYEQHWNVASDDFVLPAFLSVVTNFFSICLIVAALFTFYIAPGCTSNPVPPLLYGSFFALLVITVITAINETVILSVSSRGSILSVERRHSMTKFIYIKVFLSIAEFFTLIACTVSISLKKVTAELECDGFKNALMLSLAVVIIEWIFFAGLLLKTALYVDPCGVFSPGLLERISMFDDSDNKGSFVIAPTGAGFESDTSVGRNPKSERTDSLSRKQFHDLHYWKTKRERIFSSNITPPSFEKIESIHSKVHNADIDQRKMQRRLRAICCCLGIGGNRSRGVALDDIARGLYTIFSETDVALSDVIAGFHLLHQSQRKKVKKGKSIVEKFRKVTFRMMPSKQRYNLSPNICRPDQEFDFGKLENQMLFEELVHYMHYAMGIYGWPLHLFDNLMCGLCQLCSVTCCRCQYRCFNKRAAGKDGDFIKQDGCLCGVGVLRLRTGIEEEDIVYMTNENKIYGAPFSVCVDHCMKAVVICVRGTLSLKDALTDMSFSPMPIEVEPVKETYVHGGMYRTALKIKRTLNEKKILDRAFKGHEGYQLVVTGHSLGAGVASVLSLLLKLENRHSLLVCYAYSPPGALFSFPLAEYSKTFITSVVIGNDIVPRLTLRSLLHLKFSVQQQLQSCREPKYQVLLLPKWFKSLQRRLKEGRPKQHSKGELQSDGGEGGDGGDEVDGGEDEDDEDNIEGQIVNEFTTQEWMRSELFSRHHSLLPTESAEGVASRKQLRRQSSRPFLKTPSVQYARRTSQQYLQNRQHQKNATTTQYSSQASQDLMHKFQRAMSVELLGDEIPAFHFQAAPDDGSGGDGSNAKIGTDDGGFDEPDSGVPVPQGTRKTIPSHLPLPAATSQKPVKPATTQEATPTFLAPPISQQGQPTTTTTERLPSITPDSFRPAELCTPGTAIHSALPSIFEHCRSAEGDTFLPCFPPGRIIYIDTPTDIHSGCLGLCHQSEVLVKEVPTENFSVILVDRGLIDDHLPNRVLHNLKLCKARHLETNPLYNPDAIKAEREKREKLLKGLYGLLEKKKATQGFYFTVQSPEDSVNTRRPSYLLEREREQRSYRRNTQPQLVKIEEEGQQDTTSLSSNSRVNIEVEVHDPPASHPGSNDRPGTQEPAADVSSSHFASLEHTQRDRNDRPGTQESAADVSSSHFAPPEHTQRDHNDRPRTQEPAADASSSHFASPEHTQRDRNEAGVHEDNLHLPAGSDHGGFRLSLIPAQLPASPGGARYFKGYKRGKFVLPRSQENVEQEIESRPETSVHSEGSGGRKVYSTTVHHTTASGKEAAYMESLV